MWCSSVLSSCPQRHLPPIPLNSCPQGEGTSILKSQTGGLRGSEGLMSRHRWPQHWIEGKNSCHSESFFIISPRELQTLGGGRMPGLLFRVILILIPSPSSDAPVYELMGQ